MFAAIRLASSRVRLIARRAVRLLAATHAKLGRLDAAKADAKRVLELQPGFTISGNCAAFDMHPSIAAPLSEALSLAGLPA
jgi:adenylate cyclase